MVMKIFKCCNPIPTILGCSSMKEVDTMKTPAYTKLKVFLHLWRIEKYIKWGIIPVILLSFVYFSIDQSSSSDTGLMVIGTLAIIVLIFDLIGFMLYFSRKAKQTEEHLILDGYKKIPWASIDFITLKRSELNNRYIAIHFKDDTPPQGFNIENYPNKKELVNYLIHIASEKGFTFHMEEGAWPEKDIQKTELALEEFTHEKDIQKTELALEEFTHEKDIQTKSVEESKPPEITVSPTQKKLIMGGLAVISFLGFYYLFGLIAIILIFVLVVHETGHLLALKACHLKAHGLFFIPFVGAAVVPKEELPSPEIEAAVALGGPVAGLSLNAAALVADLTMGHFAGIFYVPVLFNFVINLLNLLPILPLDGGRIFRAVLLRGKKSLVPVGIVTVGIGALLAVMSRSILFGIIVLVGLGSFIYNYQKIEKKEISPPSWRNSILILTVWVAVIFLYWYTLPVFFKTFIRDVFAELHIISLFYFW
jgi:Zn-dependent protease